MDKTVLHESILRNTRFSFSRSGGNGGQNVNKVNTKVHAAIDLCMLEGLSDEERILLRARLSGSINKLGEIFIYVQDERFQEINKDIALKRLESKILSALKTRKRRIKTKPTMASKEMRLKIKRIKSDIKKQRKKIIAL